MPSSGNSIYDLVSPANLNEPMPWSNQRSVLIGLPIAFLVTSWICVTSRLYTRFYVIRSPWWDDLFVFLYAVCVGHMKVRTGSRSTDVFGNVCSSLLRLRQCPLFEVSRLAPP